MSQFQQKVNKHISFRAADCHFRKITQTQFQRFYFSEILVTKMLSVRQLALRSLLRPVTTSSTTSKAKHTLPDLTYDYNALEPVISAEIMQLHHSKHHQTYVNMYNVAEEKLADAVSKGITNALSFYRSQNVLCWSKFLCQTKNLFTYCGSHKHFVPD